MFTWAEAEPLVMAISWAYTKDKDGIHVQFWESLSVTLRGHVDFQDLATKSLSSEVIKIPAYKEIRQNMYFNVSRLYFKLRSVQ